MATWAVGDSTADHDRDRPRPAGSLPELRQEPPVQRFPQGRPRCRHCDAPLGLARADDAPPYFTIFVTGHIVIPLMMWTDRAYEPTTTMMAAIFLPMTLFLSLGLLRPIKGGTVGAMVTLNMLKPDPTGA